MASLNSADYMTFVREIRDICDVHERFLPLHAPLLDGKEKAYVLDAIDSTFVSSVGEYVARFEEDLCRATGAGHVIACSNGTAALQVALHLAGVGQGDLVLTQALSFVATANAIAHCGAEPVFLDVSEGDIGLSPDAVRSFVEKECTVLSNECRHKASGKRVAACVPMHTFGLPCRIAELAGLCAEWRIALVEDAAEALGSSYHKKHCGTFGLLGTLSFNGNKIVTTGGGGAIMTDDPDLARRAKHLTTTAKLPHAWEYRHDDVAWNYRLPNLNAALGCAQLERLEYFLSAKRARAKAYEDLFSGTEWSFICEKDHCYSNYWLCAVLTRNIEERDAFLRLANEAGVMTRPAWESLHRLPMYSHCLHDTLAVTEDVVARLVNLPSGLGKG